MVYLDSINENKIAKYPESKQLCIISIERNTDYKKKQVEKAKTNRILLKNLKNPNKASVYFVEQNVKSTPTDKYDRYVKHSFNVKNEHVSLL